MAVPKHGGSVKRTISYTRKRHEERMQAQAERAEAEAKMVERAKLGLAMLSDVEISQDENKWNRGEPQVVLGIQLGREIREWTKRWLADRDHKVENISRESTAMNVMGPIDWLSEKTGINVRRISGITNDEFETVGYSQAEDLLIAIDREYMLSNGEIHVIPNPGWSLERWIEYMSGQGCM